MSRSDNDERLARAKSMIQDYAKAGCVFSIYQMDDGGFAWHKRGEIDGRDMAVIRAKEDKSGAL